MKKLLLLTTLLLTISCSTESERGTEPCTSCVEVIEYATDATDYSVWNPTGEINPSDYPCSQDGYTEHLYGYLSGTGNYVRVRKRVDCE